MLSVGSHQLFLLLIYFILFYLICVKTFFMVTVSELHYWASRFKADRSSLSLFKIAEEEEEEGTVMWMWMQSMRYFNSCEFSLMSCHLMSSPSLCYTLPLGDYSTLVHLNLSCPVYLFVCVCLFVFFYLLQYQAHENFMASVKFFALCKWVDPFKLSCLIFHLFYFRVNSSLHIC